MKRLTQSVAAVILFALFVVGIVSAWLPEGVDKTAYPGPVTATRRPAYPAPSVVVTDTQPAPSIPTETPTPIYREAQPRSTPDSEGRVFVFPTPDEKVATQGV